MSGSSIDEKIIKTIKEHLSEYVEKKELQIEVFQLKSDLDKEYEEKFANKQTQKTLNWFLKALLTVTIIGIVGGLFAKFFDLL